MRPNTQPHLIETADLPLFSGTAPRAEVEAYTPQSASHPPRLFDAPALTMSELASHRTRLFRVRLLHTDGTFSHFEAQLRAGYAWHDANILAARYNRDHPGAEVGCDAIHAL